MWEPKFLQIHIPASIYENTDLQFFRTTTKIQSGSDAFDKLRLVMTFLTSLRVPEIMQFQISSRTENRQRST